MPLSYVTKKIDVLGQCLFFPHVSTAQHRHMDVVIDVSTLLKYKYFKLFFGNIDNS